MPSKARGTVFSRRLRQVREMRQLSQRSLGVEMGLDPSVASTRINRYEQSVSFPALTVLLKLAATLRVPAPMLIAEDEDLAEFIMRFGAAPKRARKEMLNMARNVKDWY
jgi:transcriptional regulator with XRE-family HTH domain